MTQVAVTESILTSLLKEKMATLLKKPKYRWWDERSLYEPDADDLPLIKVAMGHCPSTYDLWQGIRGPATVGLHPATFQDIWDYYACEVQTPIRWDDDDYYQFQVPRLSDFPYAAVASIMLVASPQQLEEQALLLDAGELGCADDYTTAWKLLSELLETSLSRTAMSLYSPDLVCVPMIEETQKRLAQEVIPAFHQKDRHGPDKGGNWPQKSVAFLTGLGQFGASRLIFRDEIIDGQVQRFYGQIRSLVLFSREDNLSGSVKLDDPVHRKRLFTLAQFRDALPQEEDIRFCRFKKGCSECIRACPSGALPHSIPEKDNARGRSSQGWQQFAASPCRDFARHSRVFPGWVCARCVVACVRRGHKDEAAVARYWQERS